MNARQSEIQKVFRTKDTLQVTSGKSLFMKCSEISFKTFYEETNKGHQMNTSDLHFIWFTKIQKFSVAQSSYCTPKLLH